MVPLDSSDRAELDRTLGDLTPLALTAAEWSDIADLLDRVDGAVTATDGGEAVERLSQAVFEAKVQQRFRGGRATSTLPPTKKVSVLPWVGGICGALLLAVGGALGGGYVLAGVALLSLGVFAVAFAGSRVAHRGGGDDDVHDVVDAVPADVADRIASLR